MRLSTLLFAIFRFLLPPAIIATTLLYLYPAAQGCGFPRPGGTASHGGHVRTAGSRNTALRNDNNDLKGAGQSRAQTRIPTLLQAQTQEQEQEQTCAFDSNTVNKHGIRGGLVAGTREVLSELHSLFWGERRQPELAPFRLMAIGDPQLEGDTSLPPPGTPLLPSLRNCRHRLVHSPLVQAPAILQTGVKDLFGKDIPKVFKTWRKRLDLWGNDYYLHHAFWLVKWWTQPTHIVVLGDLLGSQWISDDEFERRAERFWGRVFTGMERVDDEIMLPDPDPTSEERPDPAFNRQPIRRDAAPDDQDRDLDDADAPTLYIDRTTEIGSPDYKAWSTRLINVAGNHDIGYAGDIDAHRIRRFEHRFGKLNWNLRFVLPASDNTTTTIPRPELEILVLNSMNLDRPAYQPHLRDETWNHLNTFIERAALRAGSSAAHATVLLTHIPLHKPEGVCVDGPLFDHFPDSQGGGIREQNHLSWLTSRILLDGLFGRKGDMDEDGEVGEGGEVRVKDGGREVSNGIMLAGHDHEGCDVRHSFPLRPSPEDEEKGWVARPWGGTYNSNVHEQAEEEEEEEEKRMIAMREITVRSIMGAYGGNIGLLSAWYDEGHPSQSDFSQADHSQAEQDNHDDGQEKGKEQAGQQGQWRFEYSTCMLGVQHIWWAIHVFDLVLVVLLTLAVFSWVVEMWLAHSSRSSPLPSRSRLLQQQQQQQQQQKDGMKEGQGGKYREVREGREVKEIVIEKKVEEQADERKEAKKIAEHGNGNGDGSGNGDGHGNGI